jgi:hypothetical protein
MYDVKDDQYLCCNLSLVFCHLIQYLCILKELVEWNMGITYLLIVVCLLKMGVRICG